MGAEELEGALRAEGFSSVAAKDGRRVPSGWQIKGGVCDRLFVGYLIILFENEHQCQIVDIADIEELGLLRTLANHRVGGSRSKKDTGTFWASDASR